MKRREFIKNSAILGTAAAFGGALNLNAEQNLANLNLPNLANLSDAQKDKVWFITGCSSGIGKNLADKLLSLGFKVAVTARNTKKIKEFKEKYPQNSLILALDVTDKTAIKTAVSETLKHFGKIDVLVNNAGYCLRGAVEDCEESEIKRQFDTNLLAPINLIKEILPFMRTAKSGMVINISSVAAFFTAPGSAYYAASKAALESISDGLRKETSEFGIKVLLIEPGPFPTDFYGRSLDISKNQSETYKESVGKRTIRTDDPKNDMSAVKWGSVEKVAEAIVTASLSENPPFRLLLGSNAIELAQDMMATRQSEIARWKNLIVSTDE